VPTDHDDLLAAGLQSVGIQDFHFIKPVGTANTPSKMPTGARREWRINQDTGELRGVVFRERNKKRKTIGWINHDSPGFELIQEEFEAWQRTGKYPVGNALLPVGNPDRTK